MTDKFCILPWKHLTIGTEGSYKLCCVAHRVMNDGSAPMSVYHHSLEEAWNSQYMRDVRRAMLEGEAVPDCQGCYNNEESSGHSYRTTVGASLMDKPIEQVRAESLSNDYRLDTNPRFVKLELGSLCNLECRMCSAATSTQIERDPVHNRWAPTWGFEGVPVVSWNGDAATIGPQPRVGVRRAGFTPADDAVLHWADGHCSVELELDESTVLDRLEIDFDESGHHGQMLRVLVNGAQLMQLSAVRGDASVSLDLSGEEIGRRLRVEIQSVGPHEDAEDEATKFAVREMRLYRRAAGATELPRRMLYSRLPGRTLWENEDAFVFGEMLKNPGELDHLYITGGEPFLMKRVTEIIDYLIDSRNTHVKLEFSTNCTKVTPDVVRRLSMFKRVNLDLSLDGVGDTYEYIRFPAKWDAIDKNVRKLVQLENVSFCVTPVVQLYNVMTLADLCRYCDRLGLDFSLANLVHWPEHLRVSLMPATARAIAADRLRAYAGGDCLPKNKGQVLAVADHIETMAWALTPELFRQLMLFTNDLDVTRGQKFAHTHGELYHCFNEAGFVWTDETCYAQAGRSSLKGLREKVKQTVAAWLGLPLVPYLEELGLGVLQVIGI